MFGFGMVLASGCGSKTLVRLGGGNLKSLVVFVVLGLAAFATLHGITAVLRVDTVDQVALDAAAGQDLPSLLAAATGLAAATLALALGLLLGGALRGLGRCAARRPQRDVLLGGVGIGVVIVGVWWVSGRLGHVAEHPKTLEEAFLATNSQRMESLSFVSPVAYTLDWLIFFSDKTKLLTIGIVSTVGVVLGSARVALATRSFRWEGFGSAEDTANHLVGARADGRGRRHRARLHDRPGPVGRVDAVARQLRRAGGDHRRRRGSAALPVLAPGTHGLRRRDPEVARCWSPGHMAGSECPGRRTGHHRVCATCAAIEGATCHEAPRTSPPVRHLAAAPLLHRPQRASGQSRRGAADACPGRHLRQLPRHRRQARSPGEAMPRLAGRQQAYIVAQMQAFRDGSRRPR